MKRISKIRIITGISLCALVAVLVCVALVLNENKPDNKKDSNDNVITLRVCNWEEYIDLGDWDEDEAIELSDGRKILGKTALYKEFEDWYYNNYGKRVKVEYSCFGTNEDLYNQLTMGDVYDLVCPSDYMLMKLMAEDRVETFSEDFFDENNEKNYYIRGLSPYIKNVFDTNEIDGVRWSSFAAGYMWGITGVLYNPKLMTKEEASTWTVFQNEKFNRQITLKDNVRDTYFAALGILKHDELMDSEFRNSSDYSPKLADMMNDVSSETISQVEPLLQNVMKNIYALETDSGKADMITGKIIANYQWSGDAVYAMDQAEEDDVYLEFAVPKECTNLWFDGWVMLKSGIQGNDERKHVAESFVNFLSMPENVVRNMYYIGYTSVISGGEEGTVYDYLNWCYGADEEDETIDYQVGYFFSGDSDDEDYILKVSTEQIDRQVFAQYPLEDVIKRAAVMGYYDNRVNKEINQMWINIRCFNIKQVPGFVWAVIAVLTAGAIVLVIVRKNAWKID